MKSSLDLWLKSHKSTAKRPLNLLLALGLFNGLLLIVQAYFLALIVNEVVIHSAPLAEFYLPLFAILGLFLLRALLAWWLEFYAQQAAVLIKQKIRLLLYDKLQRLGPLYLQGQRSGELVNSLSDGVEALQAYYSQYLPALSSVALLPLAILVVVFPLDWWSGLVFLLTAPAIPVFMILIGKGAEALSQKQWQKLARLSAHFLDMIQGLSTLKLFNASRREAQAVAQISEEYRRSSMKVLRVAFLSSLVLEFFATVSVAIVAVLIGFRLLWGEMDFQIGFFILLLAPEFYLPLRQMGTHYHARMEGIGAAEKMVELLNEPLPNVVHDPLPLPAGTAEIELKEVDFVYDKGEPVLHGLNLKIEPGERLAIVGPSGAGKSTLMNLLLGFAQPSSGELRLGGVLSSRVALEQWHERIAWVPQSPTLFQGSLAENIVLGMAQASEAEMIVAAEQAGAHEFICQLPQGYATQIGEAGVGLSGGQIQRIALARAFLKRAQLLLLDEASANLDLYSESLVIEAMATLPKESSLIFIAHRLSTLRVADRIVVLDQGRVAAEGSHEQLLASSPLYQRLYQGYRGVSCP
ncbi:MAG: thiol reductant ABC exporter subunit CydD [Gammaproteobacteria bacterium]|nr:thiol reductant ABC exporter subunit CydD [Gammaproteobacteria bacterium]